MTAAGFPIVDAHAHVWTVEPDRYPWRPQLAHVSPPTAPAPPAALAASMADAGVVSAVLVQPSVYGDDHAFLMEAVDRHPHRFLAVCLVDPLGPAPGRELGRLGTNPAVCGVRVNVFGAHGSALLAPGPADRLYDAIESRDLTLSVQTRPVHLRLVDELAARRPGLRIVVDHLGLFDAAEPPPYPGYRAFLRLAARPNVSAKLAGLESISREPYPHRDCRPFVAMAFAAFGAARLVWGSNFPLVLRTCSYAAATGLPDLMLPDLSADDRAAVLGGTAQRLWGRPPAETPPTSGT